MTRETVRHFAIVLPVVTAVACTACTRRIVPGDELTEGDEASSSGDTSGGGGDDTAAPGDPVRPGDSASGGDTHEGDSAAPGDSASPGDTMTSGDSTAPGDTDIGGGDNDSDDCPGCWYSALYPPNWTPSFSDAAGRFVHDFSYAGYHNSDVPLPSTAGMPLYDVVGSFGADPTGATNACNAIQLAIDAAGAGGGGVVYLPAGMYRCTVGLEIRDPGVVLQGAGIDITNIFFTENVTGTDTAAILFTATVTQDPGVLLSRDVPSRATYVDVADASSFSAGDDVSVGWTITPDLIAEHNMTGTWVTFNGQWKPFFRRQVIAVDTTATPHRIILDVPLRYPAKVRDQASVARETGYLTECGIESMSVSNAISTLGAWASDRVHAIEMQRTADCWIRDVHSFDSPSGPTSDHLQSGGIKILESKRVTVSGARMELAQNRGPDGNGYLFEISKSSEILVADSRGLDGRHNFIQNWDFGTSGCVFLRVQSRRSRSYGGSWDLVGLPAASEYHHSLAMANLVDQSIIADGWEAVNRGSESSGAGHAATECVAWNVTGGGTLISRQFGWGYVIGGEGVTINTSMLPPNADGTFPEDYVELRTAEGNLEPPSLFESQLARRR